MELQSVSKLFHLTISISLIYFSLHSHSVNYPLGSGLQSVTGFSMDNDYNSLWTIKEPHNEAVKTYCIFLVLFRGAS